MKERFSRPSLATLACLLALALAMALPLSTAFADPTGSTKHPNGEIVDTDRGPEFIPFDPSTLNPNAGIATLANPTLPQKFDLRDLGRVTGVKDQGSYNTCWSFSALASLESSLLMKGNAADVDLAERHLAWFTYNEANAGEKASQWAGGDRFLTAGGINAFESTANRTKTAATLMRWYGAVDETAAPYLKEAGMGAPDASTRTRSDVHTQNVFFLPEPNAFTYNTTAGAYDYAHDPTAVEAIKTCLMNRGAVGIAYISFGQISNHPDYWNDAENACYSDLPLLIGMPSGMLTDHLVTIVGWDDAFPKDKFPQGTHTPPAGDGAWIVKNSWGTESGDEGYFYLSYYDTTYCTPTFFEAENASYAASATDHVYDGIYQYDGVGTGDLSFNSDSRMRFANVFEARDFETVSAVSTYAFAAGGTVELAVYKNPATTSPTTGRLDPTSGQLVWNTSQTIDFAGYRTFDLGASAFEVEPGDTFSVVGSVMRPNGQYEILAECDDLSRDIAISECAPGQSYYADKLTGIDNWYDLALDDMDGEGESEGYLFNNALLKAYTVKDERPFAILHTNDVHCGVDETFDKETNKATSIGYAGVSAAKKQAEATFGAGSVALVDAGDAVQGKPIGTLSKGEHLVSIMNQVGYDVATLGNHEFDYGMKQLHNLVGSANATYTSCNFDNLAAGATEFAPYVMQSYGPTRVAFVGITTPETLTASNPAHFKDANGNLIYGFCQDETGRALYNRVQQTVNDARAAGADYVVALGHLGESGVAEQWRASTVIRNTTGIDVFIDGHSHERYEQRVADANGDEVVLAQTGTQLQTYGQIVIDPVADTIQAKLVEPPVAQDADTAAFIKNIEDELAKTLDVVAAQSEVKLRALEDDGFTWAVRKRETNLGNLVSDAYRASLGADIGLANGGGIRSDVEPGDVTYGDAIAVLPFANALCKVETTGQAVLDALEMGVRNIPEPSGSFLQTSGLTYEIRTDIPSSVKLDAQGAFTSVEGPRRVQNVRVNGQPLDPKATYSVASITYLLRDGGDGFSMFKDAKVIVAEQGLDYEALIAFIQNDLNGAIGAKSAYANDNGSGRIQMKDGPDPAPKPKPEVPPATDPVSDVIPPDGTTLAPTGDDTGADVAAASTLALCALAGLAVSARANRRRANTLK